MKAVILFRGGPSADWKEQNPILRYREPGWAADTGVLKVGDGITPWDDLLPAIGQAVFNAETRFDFPSVGSTETIYKASKEGKLYQWNEETLTYNPLIEENLQINIIYGGGANFNGTIED